MSYNKLGFTSGQTLKAEHLNHMEDGIDAVASGISVKKILFTDRPSIYAWLLNNYHKVIFCDVIAATYPWHVKYLVHRIVTVNNGVHDISIDPKFSLVQISSMPEHTLVPSIIRMTDGYIELSPDATINIETNNDVTGLYVEPTMIPDEYWSVMNIEATVYYFDE